MKNRIFPPKMIVACESAINSGVSYQDEFCDFVVERMGGYDSEAVLVEIAEVDATDDNHFARYGALLARLAAKIKQAPRGHYALIHRVKSGDKAYSHYKSLVSDGTGELATGGAYDSYNTQPGSEKILERMIGYEIYQCRKNIEEQRAINLDVTALDKYRFEIGQEFKNYRLPGDYKLYSKAVITKIFPEVGRVTLFLTRRGTGKRWEATVSASGLAERLGLAEKMNDDYVQIASVQASLTY